MSDVNCPYCNKEIEINHDDNYGYEEGRFHQQECGHCEKTFVYTTEISVDHYVNTADCLNGSEHPYEKTVTYPPEFAVMRCKSCGHEKPIEK